MKNSMLACAMTAIAVMAAVPAHALVIDDGVVLPPTGSSGETPTTATGWNLARDYLDNANPNGQWSYGQELGGAFSLLAWNAGTSSYGVAEEGQVFVYKNTTGVSDFGIDTGKVSLESDWGNAAVRWIAPSAGDYAIAVAIGGSTAAGLGGFGNNFAEYAALVIDGAERASDSFIDNVERWSFTQFLDAGSSVVAFVSNPGFASGGNTQTDIAISTVPEPSSAVLFGLGFGLLWYRQKKR
jgi:hypothetical protein